jgi:excisionase family DNA binding protein
MTRTLKAPQSSASLGLGALFPAHRLPPGRLEGVMAQRLLSIDEAAEILGVGRSTTKTLLGTGRLRSVRLGSRRLIPESAIEDLIAALQRDQIACEAVAEHTL